MSRTKRVNHRPSRSDASARFNVCIIALLLLPVLACAQKDAAHPADSAAEGEHAPASITATVESVTVAKFDETVDALGTVAARVGHIALLSAPAPTRVTKVNVALGDRVAANTVLVELELPTFEAALVSADAALTAAEKASARAQRLVDAGVAPRKDAEVALVELEAARSNAASARRTRELAHVRTPIAGVITRLNALLGSNVDVGQPLVEITDPAEVDIVLSVPTNTATKLRTGQKVTLHDGDAASETIAARGRVADISAMLDSATRGVNVRVVIDSRSRTLRLGEALSGRISIATHQRAVIIPENALVPNGEGFRVFVVDSANTAAAVDVTIGARRDHSVWITEGLKGGERIVTTGAYGMDEGAKVVPAKP